METYLKFAVFTFLILNIAFLLNLLFKSSKEVEPKLIGTSAVIEEKSDSKFFKTLKDSLLKYFKPQDVDSIHDLLKIHPDVMTHENILKFSKDSKISMFLENFKREFIYVVKLNHEKDVVLDKKEIPSGELSLYSINAESLISNLNIGESSIRKCWSTRITGKIIGVVTSDNKQSLAIYYRRPKSRSQSDYRIRFIHRLHCESIEVEQSDLDLQNSENAPDYFNDISYDDFIINENLPVSYMTIQKEVLAISRDRDDYQFHIYKRFKKDDGISWKLALLGPKIDKKEFQYFHTNSLKFVPDTTNEFRLFYRFLSRYPLKMEYIINYF